MKDPSEYSNLSEDFILDEQELDRKLSNEQIFRDSETLEPEEPEEDPEQTTTVDQSEPEEPESQPTGEQKKETKLFQGLSYFVNHWVRLINK